ncbi:MAG: putative DNA modification/repair radical SAM protein [Acidobacteriota bacterium]
MRPARTLRDKLAVLADAAKYDASCASSGLRRNGAKGKLGHSDGVGICHSYTPDGRCVSLLKVLLTNYCIYDCQFCVNRASSDTRRARFKPHEIAQLFIDFYRRNYVEGLFLSSGIVRSPDYTMDQLTQVARSLRLDYGFNGYIHLKAVPGASRELIEAAGRWADRLSANVELATQRDLDRLAPEKQLDTIETTMGQIHARRRRARAERRESRKAPNFAPAGQSTQMVVGATSTDDARILTTASRLYGEHRLKRIYYSAFSPIPFGDSRLPSQPPPLVREHRLYQADWLLRFYGFAARELVDDRRPWLDLELDPKTAWALENRDFFPVDVNRASKAALLRVPGLGVRSAGRILAVRRRHRLRVDDLKKIGLAVNRALPFVVTADRNPRARELDGVDLRSRLLGGGGRQLSLFEDNSTPRRAIAPASPAAGSGASALGGGPPLADRRSAVTGEI